MKKPTLVSLQGGRGMNFGRRFVVIAQGTPKLTTVWKIDLKKLKRHVVGKELPELTLGVIRPLLCRP